MADQPSTSPSRLWRILLVVSLALNVAVLGLAGGALMRDKVGGRPPSGVEFGAGPLGRALSPDDQREIGKAIRDRVDFSRDNRPSPRRAMRELQEALVAEPFDVEQFETVLQDTVRRAAQFQTAAQDALVEHVSKMSPEERAAFAERLSKTMQRQPSR